LLTFLKALGPLRLKFVENDDSEDVSLQDCEIGLKYDPSIFRFNFSLANGDNELKLLVDSSKGENLDGDSIEDIENESASLILLDGMSIRDLCSGDITLSSFICMN
jgi:hypothetical protein